MRGGPISSGRSVRPWSALRRSWFGPNRNGYTVIEVLIVLAVTATLFVSAAIMIGGRQNRTAFEQAARNVQSQIQQVLNEVAVGYYPNNGDFTCTATATGPQFGAGSAGVGTNSGCVFVGKVIQFGVTGTDPEQFVVYTLAGLQKRAGSNTEAVNRTESQPKVVAPTTSNSSIPDRSVTNKLDNGLTTYRMWYDNGAGAQYIGAVGFMQSFAKYTGSDINSGAQNVHTVAVAGTSINAGKAATAEAINANFPTSPFDTSGGVFICFVSGATDQSGLISIGGNNRNQTVSLDIKSNRTCS